MWALAVFLGYGLVFPSRRTITIVVFAAGTSLLVELSQLYHAPWIDSIRGTTPGHLVLGSGFDPIDLICYGVGIVVGALVEVGIFRLAQKRSAA
jgi:glycopeptide antibiotics resistance protein